jgi:hypothetical protein
VRALLRLLGILVLVAISLLPGSASVYASEDWAVSMTVTTNPDVGSVPGVGYNFGFGARDGAGDGYNSGEGDEIAPPDPMYGVNAYFYYPSNPPFKKNLSVSVTGSASSIIWPLVVKMVGETGNADVTISWRDISSVPAKYTILELQDTGCTTLANMRIIDHYTFPASQGQTYNFNIVASEGSNGDVNNLEGQVQLVGRPAPPHASWITELTVTFFQEGVVVRTEDVTTDNGGDFTVPDVTVGIYDIGVKGSHTLSRLEEDIVIETGTTNVNFGTLLEGDCDNNDMVNIGDFGILADAFGSLPANGNWDERADLDSSDAINISDFGLLADSFGLLGEMV